MSQSFISLSLSKVLLRIMVIFHLIIESRESYIYNIPMDYYKVSITTLSLSLLMIPIVKKPRGHRML